MKKALLIITLSIVSKPNIKREIFNNLLILKHVFTITEINLNERQLLLMHSILFKNQLMKYMFIDII
jgi:hypothetical protein